jgi:hypothetical protein
MIALDDVEDGSCHVVLSFDLYGCLDALGGKPGGGNGEIFLRLFPGFFYIGGLGDYVNQKELGMKVLSQHSGLFKGKVGRRAKVDRQ